jgi:hypothetical protein
LAFFFTQFSKKTAAGVLKPVLVPAGSLYANKESIGLDCIRDELVASLGGGTSKGFHKAFL